MDFANDIHSGLYLRHPGQPKDNSPQWANELLNQAQDLPEWAQLKARCNRRGFAAGIATEQVLQAIIGMLPEQGQEPEQGQGADSSTTRRQLRQACRDAGQAIDTAESAVEGLTEALGIAAGSGVSQGETMADVDQLRTLYALLRDNPVMRRIAEMAGRLSRLGASHKRCKVTPAVGAIKGLTIGGDLDRILPAELVGVRSSHKVERLRTLQKIMDKRALQYLMQGTAPETRGPVIVLCDESSSMRTSGVDGWSKAVALALLTTATQQKRAYTLMGFTEQVEHQITVEPGQASMDTLLPHLTRYCTGGTSFDAPLLAALDVFHHAPSMRKADIVFITDGEDRISASIVEEITKAKQEYGLHVYGICLGREAKAERLKSICHDVYQVSSTPEQDGATIAPCIALLG